MGDNSIRGTDLHPGHPSSSYQAARYVRKMQAARRLKRWLDEEQDFDDDDDIVESTSPPTFDASGSRSNSKRGKGKGGSKGSNRSQPGNPCDYRTSSATSKGSKSRKSVYDDECLETLPPSQSSTDDANVTDPSTGPVSDGNVSTLEPTIDSYMTASPIGASGNVTTPSTITMLPTNSPTPLGSAGATALSNATTVPPMTVLPASGTILPSTEALVTLTPSGSATNVSATITIAPSGRNGTEISASPIGNITQLPAGSATLAPGGNSTIVSPGNGTGTGISPNGAAQVPTNVSAIGTGTTPGGNATFNGTPPKDNSTTTTVSTTSRTTFSPTNQTTVFNETFSGTAPPVIPRDTLAPTTTNASNATIVRKGDFAIYKTLAFHAELDIRFFDGQGREPTSDEVGALMNKTEMFFKNLFAQAPITSDAFVSFSVSNVVSTYDDGVDADLFQVEFDASLQFIQNSAVTMDTIAGVVDGANYDDYIGDYVWMSEPFIRNEFYQTHEVVFTCHALGINVQRRMGIK